MPAKVKHPGAGNSEAERGCDAQVNHSGTPYIKVWIWAQCCALGGGSKAVVTQPVQTFLPSALAAEHIDAV